MKHKVYVHVNNRTAVLLKPYPYDTLIKHWSFSVPNFRFMSGNYPGWNGKIKLLKRDRIPAGLFWATYHEIEEKENIRFRIKLDVEVPTFTRHSKWLKSEGKYDFQNECVDRVQSKLKRGRGGLVLNATGSGKTRIAAMLASRLDCEVLFVVDQLLLLEQAREEIGKHLHEKVGKVGESKFKLGRVTVATIQTLHLHRKDPKFLEWFQRVEVIIIDEIHDQMNRSNFDVVHEAQPLSVIGLTATLALTKKPVRLKAFSLTGGSIYQYPIKQGMTEGVLAKGIAILLMYNNSVKELRSYKHQELYENRIVRNEERNFIISEVIKRANKAGKYTIVLVERLKHLEKLSRRLKHVPHKIVAGTFKGEGISVSRRMKRKDKFESGKIRVILANKVFKKGIDIKRVDVIINAAGRKSQNDAIQIFGRGVRQHKDKVGLEYIDIFDIDEFDKERKKKKNPLAMAAKRRKRALKAAGITIREFQYEDEDDLKQLFKQADKWLGKEIKCKVRQS